MLYTGFHWNMRKKWQLAAERIRKKAALIYYTSKLEKNVYALENDLPAEPKTGEPVEDEITDESVELPEEEPEQGTAEAEASSKTDSEKEDETDKKTEEAITLEPGTA